LKAAEYSQQAMARLIALAIHTVQSPENQRPY
jgi:hypothetical protein